MTDKEYSYQNSDLPVNERVADLIARMTLAEKIAQIGSYWVYEILDGQAFDQQKVDEKLSEGVGQITRLAGASSLDPTGCAKLANEIQHFLCNETRLGIPAMIHEECCCGYTAKDATIFPQIIGLASTWEPELAWAMTNEIRQQMRAVGAHQGLSPILDVGRDPRWGRIEETFGEDPYMIARMGVAYINGLQGESLDEGVLATVKHFVGYSVTEGGLNWAPAHIAEREMREIYLHPFEAAVKEANVHSLMSGYHELDGIPVSASEWLLDEVLRKDWGFTGLVVSDYMSINSLYEYHNYARDKAEASFMSIEAGVDVELPTTDCYGPPMIEAVQSGRIPESLIDQSVERILRAKFELGLFEDPYVDPEKVTAIFDTEEQRELAYTIAQKSMTLLKNEDDLLPLSKELDSIAIIGPNADAIRGLVGDYSYAAHIELLAALKGQGLTDTPLPSDMSLENIFVEMPSIKTAIGARVSVSTNIRYAKGCGILDESTEGFAEAVTAAKDADVAIVVVGDKSGLTLDCSTGEFRDRATLHLPGVQEDLVKAVVATGTPVVVVLANGRPVSSPWIAENVPAILEAWFPGEEGGTAVADVLFGDLNPGGKLPLTVLRTAGQVPLFYNRKPSGGKAFLYGPYADCSNEPLYPFGYGLSYTTFELSDLAVNNSQISAGDQVQISCKITNSGQRAGDEVVQLYIKTTEASVTRPIQELKGFQRIRLEPGETKQITFTLFANQLGYYDRSMNYVLEPSKIELMMGTSSVDIALRGEVELIGDVTEIYDSKVFFSQSSIL